MIAFLPDDGQEQVPTPSQRLLAFIRLTRPVFLLGGVLLHTLGLAIAASQGLTIHLATALLSQTIVTFTQVMAHYSNEYFDFEGDKLIADSRTLFSGGSGVLSEGVLSPNVALMAARFCGLCSLLAMSIAFTVQPLVGLLGLIALAGSWYYSAPPLSLMGSGWGELTTSIIVTLLVPLMGYAMQAGRIDPSIFAICVPLLLIHWAMIVAFEFPDYDADKAVGKQTFTVRFGKETAARVHNVALAMATIALTYQSMMHSSARFLWIAVPLSVWQFASVWSRANQGWNRLPALTFGAVGLFSLTSLLWVIGFVWRN